MTPILRRVVSTNRTALQDYEAQFTKSLLEVAEEELDRNAGQLLTIDRRKAISLIDGALERSGVYQKAEDLITPLIPVDAVVVLRDVACCIRGPFSLYH